ncbi:MAG: TonB-dependent receptor [Ferruginibacter sp.]|nr:TonB-dependent receptor [Ferruginibacter sp.]MBN8700208.1 TonB-dependent receptor [Chitinophagales bacterium]
MNMGHFYGKVLDSVSNKPLEAASVQLIQNKFDSATKKRKDVVVGGMLTTKKGEFSIENLPIMATYKLKITAIGYKTIEKRVNFEMNMSAARSGDFSSMLSAVDKDLGNIKLEADAKQLENVTVSASKATLEMKIDRKVFNVEKNLNSVGGTAVDVMKNVPSVNVDIDGNVSLRNASPQIFVDGRPTTMTLDQIPADAIASVEIITNPSAKYDASGGGAGILNIILKKNRKAGYNGNLRAGIDMRGRPNLGGDVNMKQGKVNFFAAGQFGMRKSISNVKTDRVDYNADTTSYLKQRNKPINSGFFAFGRAGMDYFIDNRNTLSIGGNLVRGQFKTTDLINTYRDTVRPSGTISDRGERGSKSTGNFRNYGATLSFKHNFAKANKELTADFNYNYSKNDNVGDYTTQYFFSNNSPKTPQFIEQSKGGGTNRFITIQTDYADPITSSMKIEAGLRAAFRNFTSFNNNFVQTTPGQYLLIPGLSNDYKFNDELYAGYLTFSHQRKKLSYQLGLRAESSSYTGNLVSKNQKFKTEYPLSLFPSAFATYKLNDKEDMQLNYSRKINRPNFFQLIPFIDYSDSLNLSVGNPGLIPEFTNLLELSYSNQYKAGNSLLATVYFRNTNDLITRYQYKDANPNPARADSVIITTYANANRSYTVGLELTGKNKPAKWWDLTTNLNLFNSTIKAGNIPGTVSSSLFSWFAKINNNFKLPKNFSIQLSADYTAKTLVAPGGGGNRGMGMMFGGGSQPSAQGYIKPIFGADFSIRKEFLKNNAASITLQFSDIFRTRLYATHNESAFFVQDNERRRDPQFVRLNFNWRFGKIDVSLFKRKNLKGEMENMQNAQQGMGGN